MGAVDGPDTGSVLVTVVAGSTPVAVSSSRMGQFAIALAIVTSAAIGAFAYTYDREQDRSVTRRAADALVRAQCTDEAFEVHRNANYAVHQAAFDFCVERAGR